MKVWFYYDSCLPIKVHLLGLMHGKFRRSNIKQYLKEFDPECRFANNLPRYSKSKHYVNPSSEHMEDILSEIFPGFHPIRNVGNNLLITNPTTPEFATYVDNTTKYETRITQNEQQKLVKEKLKKRVLSSDHNACGGKLQQVAANATAISNQNEVRLQETTVRVKDSRTSLWELFQKSESKSNIGQHFQKKTNKYSSVHLVRKILKGCSIVGTSDSTSAYGKLHKILRQLRWVHPEKSSPISQNTQNLCKYLIKSNVSIEEGLRRNDNQMLSQDPAYPGGATNWKRERWINSDAEYLILELYVEGK